MPEWTTEDMPSLNGRVALVTGANSGLGLETTRALAARGAQVIMACRNLQKGEEARTAIKATLPDANLELRQLDLASLASIRDFATGFLEKHARLDLLFNNAGVMAIPRSETKDGFEMQFGSNHLGHFALTGLLLSALVATPESRVVTTSSKARSMGTIKFADLQRTRSYRRWESYGQSKLSNLLFAFELQRRLASAGAPMISVAAHPGFAHTNLQTTSATVSKAFFESIFYATLGRLVAQSAMMGALPQLYAGTSLDIHGGELVGPESMGGMRGYPIIERQAQAEDDKETAAKLWDISVKLTGVDYRL